MYKYESIFPDQISGNPMATIIMIGERVVDFIKKDEKSITD
ncbi:hypothetical protein B4U80_01883 [Leptotrombidium deliense]|uniref:Uncharacterized protein n=1 Tax=Leptotrombidium deliense TaxID=299467 RepID=A0A443QQA6_9ACAR|nr:hypothetical protein B4U80_01883 [Leptotrombidium deliense]